MSTVRLQIVDAMAAALSVATGLTAHRNLDYALEDGNLPFLEVVSGPDAPLPDSPYGVLDQVVDVDVAICVKDGADREAAADPYEAQVHASLMGTSSFGGHSVEVRRTGGTWDFDLGDLAARRVSYRVSYRTSYTNLET